MTQSSMNPAELGRHLMQVRERAGVKQAELAKRVSLSAAVLSRIESGERPVSLQEVEDILAQIKSDEAAALSKAIHRTWEVLPRPPLDHPDQDLLWEAELLAVELRNLRDRPETPHAFERRLSDYIEELKRGAALLLKQQHQIAFIGSIGVGKSTAICKLTDLEITLDDGRRAPVLEVGGGGITVCEVHLREGPQYGIIVEPRTLDEIRQDVADLADHILLPTTQDDDDGARSSESQGISKEIARALRNMAGLAIQRSRAADGRRSSFDPAKDLAKQFPNARDFVVEILARLELHRRDTRDVWYDSSTGKSPEAWLRDTFSLINNGRHPDFGLPKRMEVVIPKPLLTEVPFAIRMVDTKGIDRTAAREDIELHFDDPHTLPVLCCMFNNAPSAEARLLLERAREAGIRGLEESTALLVLPRVGEALAMKDDATGAIAESPQEGCELKADQISLALEPLGMARLPTCFYNAYEDDPSVLQRFLADRILAARARFRDRTSTAIAGARLLLKNHGQQRVEAVLREASKTLQTWLALNAKPSPSQAHVQESLMVQLQIAYASTVRASVRREGEWSQLSYSHHIGYGARRVAVLALGKAVDDFTGHCRILAATPDYADAVSLIVQAERVLTLSYEELLRKVQLMAQTVFKEALSADSGFWQSCMGEWGRGPGYKARVEGHNREWFDAEARRRLEVELRSLIEREWARALQNVRDLLEPTVPAGTSPRRLQSPAATPAR